MPATDKLAAFAGWRRLGRSLSAKLIALLLAALLASFCLFGYLNIRLHRKHLEDATLRSAERVGDTLKRSMSYYMLHNDRTGLVEMMETIAGQPGIVRVRVFDRDGRINYSTDQHEVNQQYDRDAEMCAGCHAQNPVATQVNGNRFRIYKGENSRVVGVITPIENQPACSNAACHAHPAGQQILGVLDTNLSLAEADANLAQGTWRMGAYTAAAILVISFLSCLFVWRVVDEPIHALEAGTRRLGAGELGYQIPITSHDEVGELAESFNGMSRELLDAREEVTAWAHTLEDRVEQKTKELKRAHEHVLQVEKMASIGKLAAVLAHEINNPLSGILTYAKLMRKWLDNDKTYEHGPHRAEVADCLDLIASESRRCGDLVKNLLTFSRVAPLNIQTTDINNVVERTIRLVEHQLDLRSIQLQLELSDNLPLAQCDPAQIEQVLLALIMNAIDAMPRGGNLWLRTAFFPESGEIEVQVRDDGMGIAPDLLPRIFDPFLTTKETGQGVGLGLAISRSIVERHCGRISVQSELGRGTTFCVVLPQTVGSAAAPPADLELAAGKMR
jgi:two-component system, NtrC family, sensor kinase